MRTVDPAKHAARRRQILDAAAGVFAARGFDATTVAEICKAASTGSGTLFHYFSDKAAVFRAIFEDDHEHFLTELAAIDTADPAEEFWKIVDLISRDAADPASGGLVIAMLARLPQDPDLVAVLLAGDEAAITRLTGAITRLQRRGEADPSLPAEHAARWVSSIVDGLYLRCGDPGFDPETELRTLRLVLSRFLFHDAS